MKLRIRENTIRLRLKQSEVERLAAGEAIVEHSRFPTSVLTYCLRTAKDSEVSADFESGTLTVYLPPAEVAAWAGSDQISIFAEQRLEDSTALSLLIEKDFKCLSPGHGRVDEDDVDTYPHPEAGTGKGC